MVFQCVDKKCGEIWFVQRLYDGPRNNLCPHCGQFHFEHQKLSLSELEELINKIRTAQENNENWLYNTRYSNSHLTKYLERVLHLETIVDTMDKTMNKLVG